MFAVRNLIKSNAQFAKTIPQVRNMTAIGTAPRNKVSRGEVILLATAMVISWCAIPAWVLVNMKHYRNKD